MILSFNEHVSAFNSTSFLLPWSSSNIFSCVSLQKKGFDQNYYVFAYVLANVKYSKTWYSVTYTWPQYSEQRFSNAQSAFVRNSYQS